jgi:hypothetical protein
MLIGVVKLPPGLSASHPDMMVDCPRALCICFACFILAHSKSPLLQGSSLVLLWACGSSHVPKSVYALRALLYISHRDPASQALQCQRSKFS